MSLLFLALGSSAHAFCGTFVGAPGAELANHTSQVVYARDGRQTTITLVADYSGDLSEFALVIPVPQDLDPRRIRTIEPEVVDRLDRYSTPRLVQYTCQDAITYSHPVTGGAGCAMTLGCGGSEMSADFEGLPGDVEYEGAEGAVTVEHAFEVAEYDVAILSAEGAEGLYVWLDEHGFGLPPGGEDVLQEYIDGGVDFLAARVSLEDVPAGTTRLSPLQLQYDTDVLGLPIRIGTISGGEEQEVLIYGLTDANAAGELEIRNYPEVRPEDECMVPEGMDVDFVGFYRDGIRSAAAPVSDATWYTEYSWTLYREVPSVKCDPCTVEEEELYSPGELAELGFSNGDAHLTRLRMTYDPTAVPEDLVLATRPIEANQQMRFIQYDRQLEFLFPVCGSGYAEEPGECGDDGSNAVQLSRGAWIHPTGLGALAMLVLAGLRRRRDS